MHDVTTPSVNTVSLVHGVAEEITTQRDEEANEGSNAFVSSSVDNMLINTGDLILNNPGTSMNNKPALESTTSVLTTGQQTTMSTIESTTITPITTEITTKVPNYISNTPGKIRNNFNETYVEQPPEMSEKINALNENEKDNVAYEPEDMQGDSFPSIRSYGIEKLQFFKFRSQLEQVKEVLHIFSNDTADVDNNLQKFHYDSENSATKKVLTSSTPQIMTNVPEIVTKTPITTKLTAEVPITTSSSTETTVISEHVTTNAALTTSNSFTTHNEHVTATPSLSVTNDSVTTSSSTETTIDEAPTVNTVDTKLPDVTNSKHVFINLTISADDAESSSYKQLYSFTLTVPTVGDTNEIPTVKITPLDADPTQPSNFNKPVTLEGSPKNNSTANDEIDQGGSCECSCPACISNATDDFYDDSNEDGTTTASAKSEPSIVDSQISSTDNSYSTESTTEDLNKSPGTTESVSINTDSTMETSELTTLDENISITEFTTDSTTETEILSTTDSLKFVCPKIKPPPILILEGEVDLQ